MTRIPEVHNRQLMPFRFREIGGKVLLTNDAGNYLWMEPRDFGDFLAGTLRPEAPAYRDLQSRNLIRNPESEVQVMERVRRRSGHLFQGPSLHIVILTLRCNQSCRYCHASRKPRSSKGFDMSRETASKVLDKIFESPSRDLTIEFQGGEPALNFEVLKFFVEDAYRRNADGLKNLYFSLVSNLSTLKPGQIDYLVDQGVMVCTSIDGPGNLHDRNRPFGKQSSYQATRKKMKAFDQAYRKRRLDPELAYVNALVTVSRAALSDPQAVVDEYVSLGHKVIHLRPLNPFGMGQKIWSREGYSADEFLKFYLESLDYIIQLNQQGTEIMEKMASLMLSRILTEQNVNYMDLRSPCGAGLGQLAYNHDGRVYTCDEGRMVGAMGDDLFCIGNVYDNSFEEMVNHPGVRSLCVASCTECLPGCSDCAYAPYCGVCPVYNYIMEGDLVARSPSNDRCRIQKGMFDYLFKKLAEPGMEQLLGHWTETRDRSSVYRRREG